MFLSHCQESPIRRSGAYAPGMSIVLVHGAWHGAWCWERVVEILAGEGVPAVAVQLPGDDGLPGDLHADAGAVRRALDGLGSPAVLCGHSYGGAVITEAGTHPAVAHLVYVAAFTPDHEHAVRDLLGPERRAPLARLGDDGLVHLDPVGVASLYHDCDPATVEWAATRTRPQRPEGFSTPVPLPAWKTIPSTYVVCTADPAVSPRLQRQMADQIGAAVVEWPCGHSPFAGRPELVAGLLAELDARVGGGAVRGGGPRPAARP